MIRDHAPLARPRVANREPFEGDRRVTAYLESGRIWALDDGIELRSIDADGPPLRDDCPVAELVAGRRGRRAQPCVVEPYRGLRISDRRAVVRVAVPRLMQSMASARLQVPSSVIVASPAWAADTR